MIYSQVTGIGDPFVLLYEDTYYMYATSSGDGFRVWTSRDLKSWEDRGLCYRREGSFGYECFWAPEVVRRSDGKFVMHFTARWKKNSSLRTGVAVADSPLGPFVEPEPGQPMFDAGYATIDAHCFTDADGRNYLLYVRDVAENIDEAGIHRSEIYLAPVDESLTKLTGEGTMILTPSGAQETTLGKDWWWNEGPFVLLHKGKYYLNYSYNCYDMREYSVGVAVADQISGPYEKVDRNLLRPRDGLSGPGHNAYFRTREGQLMCAFHIHTDPEHPSGDRRACFTEACFDAEGRLKVDY